MAPEDVQGAFREKFRLDDLTVHESDDWTLSVRPGQPVLGSLVLSSRHLALDLSQVPPRAGGGLLGLMAQAETAARRHFGAVRLNVLCLMMQDPLVHFHLLPRYGATVEFAGTVWSDSGWPGPPNLADNNVTADEQLAALCRVYSSSAWQ